MSSSHSLNGKCRQISLDEIKDATNNFHEDNVLGHGGEGKVYLAKIKFGRKITQVAVKHLKPNSQEFEKEIKTISNIQHPNLVSLLGYCDESGQKILLYEYMEKGSLADYVKKNSSNSLSWLQRIRICLDAARGLQYLHVATDENPKGIIHRDVKPDNILLGKDWVAKISDFGMFKLSHAGQVQSTTVTGLKGTGGYYAPEYLRHQSITRKIDVYAFGVVLFEVLCHKMPWDRGDESYYWTEDEDLGAWAYQNVDPSIKPEISDDSLKAFSAIIGTSLKGDPRKRPSIDGVVLGLEKVLKSLEKEDKAKKGGAAKESSSEHSTAGSRRGATSLVSETIAEDGGITKIENICGFHGCGGWHLDAIGLYVKPKRNLSVGLWGSQEPGNQWTYEPKGAISNIFITHDDVIYSIRFTSQDDEGNVVHSETFGWTTGSKSDEIAIDIKNEKLNCISGTVGVKSGYVSITSLSFSTDKNKTFGPYGNPKGTAFSLLAKDQGFVGFHGRSGSWLDAIGVYLKPIAEQSFQQWGCQQPENAWSYVPKGAISHISFTHDDAINTIRFTSQDDKGNLDHSKTFGWTTGTKTSEIDIDIKKEKLNNISGTTDMKSGYLVVTSLSFSTTKNTVFGPFGTPRGTAFSAKLNNGTLSGFFGRSGYWLDAIGVVVKPIE